MELDKENVEIRNILKCANFRNKKILEVGCGDGRITLHISRLSKNITAIDPDVESIRVARKEVKGVNFLVGSGENLEFADNSFDIVLFTMSLHHQNPKEALREAQRVLKKKSRIVVVEPNIEGEVSRLFWVIEDENNVVKKSKEAIYKSIKCGLNLLKEKTIDIDWVFEDVEELYGYFFGYHKLNRFSKNGGTIVRKLNKILGSKYKNSPLIVEEKVNIFVLEKGRK